MLVLTQLSDGWTGEAGRFIVRGDERGRHIVVRDGFLFLTGWTTGSLFGRNKGGFEAIALWMRDVGG